MLPGTKARVRERAGNACEYCHLHQDNSPLAVLHIEHIIPKIHGGDDDLDNLALACIDCNLHKGPNLTGIDPKTGDLTELFHPRHHDWEDHFAWDGIYLVSNTPIGRTTIRVLNMNSEEQLALRSS
ncbi:MAG TPA: HNH endonuclease [Pyrinomonadaceae bacterium]|nr:HNH endonuclease [Pyrinomonadaceae bacterium]